MIPKDQRDEYKRLKKELQEEFNKKKRENGGERDDDKIRSLQEQINEIKNGR